MLFVQVGTKHLNINEAKNTVLNENVKDHVPSCILQLYHLLYLSCIIYFQLHAFNLVHCEFQAAHRVEFRTTTPTTWSTKRRYRAGSIFLKENNISLKKMSSEAHNRIIEQNRTPKKPPIELNLHFDLLDHQVDTLSIIISLKFCIRDKK